MPSNPPVFTHRPVDFDHLKRMTFGERALEREVLRMFLKQAGRLLDALAEEPAEALALVHTLKGSAKAVGAFDLADGATLLEEAIRQDGDLARPLAALRAALGEARSAIEARLGRV
jgi:HPt (histidine-containing phosphotransfer) domain-containing protein